MKLHLLDNEKNNIKNHIVFLKGLGKILYLMGGNGMFPKSMCGYFQKYVCAVELKVVINKNSCPHEERNY